MACSGRETAFLVVAALGSIQYCARVFDGELFLKRAFYKESFFCKERRLYLNAKSKIQEAGT